ncbi:MAG: glycoside hydrolase family 2 TIM barrel-domain containing protein, partial [Pseudomonadota bacterium]
MLPIPLSQILDPTLLGLGRLPARASLTPYADEARLRHRNVDQRQLLDGIWRFQLIYRPELAPETWVSEDTSSAPWRDINVPGVWTRQKTGDLPHYANWHMPFDCAKPPEIPKDNPTGLYRTTFQVPSDWFDRRTVLHIGGFESLAMVWCNGQFVGLAKDSRLPSEFDLSAAVQDGENQLAIMVLRWCDATWIEDQDHWNHGGLHRSVWIESRAETHVRDVVIDTDFDPETSTGTASLNVRVEGPSKDYVVTARLEDARGNIVIQPQSAPIVQFDTSRSMASQWKQSFVFAGYAASLSLSLPHAQPWSAEAPTRYRLITELATPDGATVEIHETWIGFTRIETGDRRLRVNGRPIVLIGVNRHDHHPENGKTCSEADIRAELLTMKRHNINAIRTAHYPNDPVLLDLADELGFYVIDEANVECHARWTEVAQHAGYRAAIVDRTVRMIARDRNHPCVIGWSLGNEAGHGPAHDAAAAATRRLDPTRFVHYEGAVAMRFSFPFGRGAETMHQAPPASERATTDVVCPMYASTEDIVNWARWAEASGGDDRPLLLCEFSHAMGNSNGSLTEYVDAFFDEPALAGGFVWDRRDQGLAEIDANGNFYW